MTEVDTSDKPVVAPQGSGRGGWNVSDMCLQERIAASAVRRFCGDAVLVFAVGCGAQARNEGHLVDALALRGDEGRSTLR